MSLLATILKLETKRLSSRQQEGDECPECDGSGYGDVFVMSYGPEPCPQCRGMGKILSYHELWPFDD